MAAGERDVWFLRLIYGTAARQRCAFSELGSCSRVKFVGKRWICAFCFRRCFGG